MKGKQVGLAFTGILLITSCVQDWGVWRGGKGDGGGTPAPPAEVQVTVRDICIAFLPGAWILVEDRLGLQSHKTGVNEEFWQLQGLQPPVTVTIGYRKDANATPWFTTWVFSASRFLYFTVPTNQENCPPPPPPGNGGGPTPGSLEGDILSSTGGEIEIRTSSGGYQRLQSGQIHFRLTHIYPGKLLLYATEYSAGNVPTRFGMLKDIQLAEGENKTGLQLDLTAPYATQVNGSVLYPTGFTPNPGPAGSYYLFSVSLATGGYISSLGRVFDLSSGSYRLNLPDFTLLPLDPTSDLVVINAAATQTLNDRGTSTPGDDWSRNVNFYTTRLVGQFTSSPVDFDIPFLPIPSPLEPAEGAQVSRNGLTLKWQKVPDPTLTGYTLWIRPATLNQIIWSIVVDDPDIISVRLPTIPNNEFDAFTPGEIYYWSINTRGGASSTGSSAESNLAFSIQP